jgi:hypothetical protein
LEDSRRYDGRKALLLIGYKQKSQFDIDRWLIGIDTKAYKVNVFEVPVVSGLIPYLISKKIDDGMRSGIPEELWTAVVTVYEDADKIISFLGNEDALNARVVLLDEKVRSYSCMIAAFRFQHLSSLVMRCK